MIWHYNILSYNAIQLVLYIIGMYTVNGERLHLTNFGYLMIE